MAFRRLARRPRTFRPAEQRTLRQGLPALALAPSTGLVAGLTLPGPTRPSPGAADA